MRFEELLQVDNSPNSNAADGKPTNKSYLESGLPASIQKAITEYLQGEKGRVLHLGCLSDELYGAINSNLWGGRISEEQADYLREKHLYGTEVNTGD